MFHASQNAGWRARVGPEGIGDQNGWSPGPGDFVAVILVVEDEVFVREMAEAMVDDFGHLCLSACGVEEALQHLQSPQHIDAMFTDIRLNSSILGGFEIAIEAVKLRPQLRVLYTTGSTISDEMKALFVDGAHLIQKPYTQNQLQYSVEALLAAALPSRLN